MNLLSVAYGTGARLRRTWYARHPDRVRHLARPVISVGNLTVGGSGKTPVVAAVATLLREAGERPVILSRGYARRDRTSPTVVVSDETSVLEPVERSGDEPQMLARALPGIPVVVAADRYAAGTVAQSRFDVTVFLLDDGFQHVQLGRDVDIVIASAEDLDERVLPAGRLREPLVAAASADAVLVYGGGDEARRVADALGVQASFVVSRRYDSLRALHDGGGIDRQPRRVLAVAGIGNPTRFFDALRVCGWDVAGEMRFPDHHWFDDADRSRIDAEAQRVNADIVITTEKDAMRLAPLAASACPIAYLPMRVAIEPAFASWLVARIRTNDRRGEPAARSDGRR